MWLQQLINPDDMHSESKAQDRLVFVAASAGGNLDFLKTHKAHAQSSSKGSKHLTTV